MNYLTLEEILRLHYKIVEDYGGSHGVRDESRLLSVVQAPKQTASGIEQYPGIYDRAAVYMRNVVSDHPFFDGNKRTGTALGVIFLSLNDIHLAATPRQLEDFAVLIATDRLDVASIAMWLQTHAA